MKKSSLYQNLFQNRVFQNQGFTALLRFAIVNFKMVVPTKVAIQKSPMNLPPAILIKRY